LYITRHSFNHMKKSYPSLFTKRGGKWFYDKSVEIGFVPLMKCDVVIPSKRKKRRHLTVDATI